jgi:hypothetical protein
VGADIGTWAKRAGSVTGIPPRRAVGVMLWADSATRDAENPGFVSLSAAGHYDA